MLRGGPEHRGTNDGAPSSSPQLLWTVHPPQAVGAPIVTSGNARIYVPTLTGLVALDETGATKWMFAAEAADWATEPGVALFRDNRILVFDEPAGSLTVLDGDGKVVANTKKSWGFQCSRLMVRDDRGYFTALVDGAVVLHVVDVSATEVMTVDLGPGARGSEPSITSEGDVWVTVTTTAWPSPNPSSRLVRVSAQGALVEDVLVPAAAMTPTLGIDGSVFFAAEDPTYPYPAATAAFRLAKGKSERIVSEMAVIASLGMSPEGALVVSSAAGYTETDALGMQLYTLSSPPPTSSEYSLWSWSVVAGDGTRILAAITGRVYGVRKGKVAWDRLVPGSSGQIWGPNLAISSGGLLIVSSTNGEVAAFR